MLKPALLALGLSLGLAGCAASHWETQYEQLNPAETKNWRVTSVEVRAPETLTTSEQNTYTPDFDVVWHGEPYGDRRAQAAAIVKEGIQRGVSVVHGKQKVRLVATITQFHALSPITRESLSNSGVHNVQYDIQVFDVRTGAPLTQPQNIKAELPGLVGAQGNEADAKGFTQKAQITQHISRVTQNWLGYGADPRGTFSRMGR